MSLGRKPEQRHYEKDVSHRGVGTEWVKFDKEEMHMNFKRCIYADLTAHYGCPELCTVIAQFDFQSVNYVSGIAIGQ